MKQLLKVRVFDDEQRIVPTPQLCWSPHDDRQAFEKIQRHYGIRVADFQVPGNMHHPAQTSLQKATIDIIVQYQVQRTINMGATPQMIELHISVDLYSLTKFNVSTFAETVFVGFVKIGTRFDASTIEH